MIVSDAYENVESVISMRDIMDYLLDALEGFL